LVGQRLDGAGLILQISVRWEIPSNTNMVSGFNFQDLKPSS